MRGLLHILLLLYAGATFSPTTPPTLCTQVVAKGKGKVAGCRDPPPLPVDSYGVVALVSPLVEFLDKGSYSLGGGSSRSRGGGIGSSRSSSSDGSGDSRGADSDSSGSDVGGIDVGVRDPPDPDYPYVFTLPLLPDMSAYLANRHLGREAMACEWKQEEGENWQRKDCYQNYTDFSSVTCHCSHLTLFGIILRSEPLPLTLQYILVPCYGVAAVVLFVQLVRVISAARLMRKGTDSPAALLGLQHALMLLVVGLRVWFVMMTKQAVWDPEITVALGVLPSLLIEILVLHVVAYWAHILAFPMQKDRWASLRVPFGVVGFGLVLVGVALVISVKIFDSETIVRAGNLMFAIISALTFVVVLVSGRGIIQLLENGPDDSLRVRYGHVTLGLCLSLFFQAVAMVLSVELPNLFIPVTAVFYGWDILSLGFLALLYARAVSALARKSDMRSSVQEGEYKPLKHTARTTGITRKT